jgi:hypothetical protein
MEFQVSRWLVHPLCHALLAPDNMAGNLTCQDHARGYHACFGCKVHLWLEINLDFLMFYLDMVEKCSGSMSSKIMHENKIEEKVF